MNLNKTQSSLITESPSSYNGLEKMAVSKILENINHEDSKIHLAVKRAIPSIEKLVENLVEKFKQGGRLFYIGAGTSGRLGVLDASEIPPTFGVSNDRIIGIIAGGDTALRTAVEGAEDDTKQAWKDLSKYKPTNNDTVVGIAASGTTRYVLGGLTDAKKQGLFTACITNNPGSPITKFATIAIQINVGSEFVTGSTRMKSGTSQKLVLNMISTSLMIKLGKVKGNKMVDMQLNNTKLFNRGVQMIMDELSVSKEKAKQLLNKHKSVRAAISSCQQK